MKLTQFTDYSLRVLIYLGAQPDRRATVGEIATAFGISEHHLTKVVHFLGKQAWIATVRGKGGGLTLGRAADAISIGQVVRDTEGGAVPAECFDPNAKGRCAIASTCRLSGVLAEAVQGFYAVLDRYTLADLLRNRQALTQVLHLHRTLPKRRMSAARP
jgi:Rrf2 family transcriptional regulator, nitric oxide-sensitive transcriptional repressor